MYGIIIQNAFMSYGTVNKKHDIIFASINNNNNGFNSSIKNVGGI